jgi:protein-tyrosine phosphatase
MASILRQIIAGPRTRHPESNLDLCYVTPFLIATSGPSGTYPQRAYRNPLDQLVKYLDNKHGEDWCIWEFRAEGTGYPDSEVHGRVQHYPWPDHHPPPFAVVPLVMGGMKKWLNEDTHGPPEEMTEEGTAKGKDTRGKNGRVVIVHCKAGKGRSGTMACSYLISECGWTAEESLARFTERRMRPSFGQGVSIPSQLRWVGYVDRWTRGGKKYVEQQIEILELHVWGLRDGVKVAVEGYIEEGKVIKAFHIFDRKERFVVEGTAPGGASFKDMITDMAGYSGSNSPQSVTNEANVDSSSAARIQAARKRTTMAIANSTASSSSNLNAGTPEAGGEAVMFKPASPLIVPSGDINIDFERRNKASYGLTMVTSVAHVWFNPYFEGNGPELDGKPEQTGLFEIEWDKMDGIKGSLRKGTRALDRMAVVWKVHKPTGEGSENEIKEPDDSAPIKQMAPADWKGAAEPPTGMAKALGLRTESPASANVSKANSVKSSTGKDDSDEDSVKGVKPSGPGGEDDINAEDMSLPKPEPGEDVTPVHGLADVNGGLDTVSKTNPLPEGEK